MSNRVVLFFKSRVDPYVRGNRIVRGYTNRKQVNHRKDAGPTQLAIVFPRHGDYQTVPPPMPAPAPDDKKFYVTMIREPGPRQRVAFLAGPFDTHEEALAQVDPARRRAEEVDPRASFDAFGTSGLSPSKLPAGTKMPIGKLNEHLGIAVVT